MFDLIALTAFSLSVHMVNPPTFTHQLGGGVTYHTGASIVLQTKRWDYQGFYFRDSYWDHAAGIFAGPKLFQTKHIKTHLNVGGYVRWDTRFKGSGSTISLGEGKELQPMIGLGATFLVPNTPIVFRCMLAGFVNNFQIGIRFN